MLTELIEIPEKLTLGLLKAPLASMVAVIVTVPEKML
mgnify:CR=1 FL=1